MHHEHWRLWRVMTNGFKGKQVVVSVFQFKCYECIGDGEVQCCPLFQTAPSLGIESRPFVDLYELINSLNYAAAHPLVDLD